MTKMKYYKQAEKMFIYDKEPIEEIGAKLNISRRTFFIGKRNTNGIEKDLRLSVIKKI